MCVEICGDGKNFGLLQCDDGNLVNGDGCDNTCAVESGWYCYGGSSTTADECIYVETTLDSINVTDSNNLVLKFSGAVYIVDSLTTDDIQIDIRAISNE